MNSGVAEAKSVGKSKERVVLFNFKEYPWQPECWLVVGDRLDEGLREIWPGLRIGTVAHVSSQVGGWRISSNLQSCHNVHHLMAR